MTRRRFIALVSALVLAFVGFVVLATGLFVTRTRYGQTELTKWVQGQLQGAMRGKVYLGRISGSFLTGITIDSLAIRDADDDSLLVTTGRITAWYDPRDLIDRRIWLRRLEVEHPVAHLRQHASGRWNFKEIFKAYERKPQGPKAPGRSFGDFVRVDSAYLRDAQFVLRMPWHPDDSLRGPKLDSAVRHNLTRPDKEIRRIVDEGAAGFARTWRWTGARAVASHMRIADPDSDRFGKLFVLDTLNIDEHDPPFRFRNVRGTITNLGDSIWVDVPHFDLPGSVGSGKGKVVWGSDLPVRYDLMIRGDSVSLADVNWVYPTLPTTGGGTMWLHIKNERNLEVIDYALTQMDVRSTGSHLTGNMTFAVGGPVLQVKDVDMVADPVDFDLLRTFNGKPFPVDWRGQIFGSVKARGGPLNRFVVDAGQGVWRDTHVRGAESRFSGRGELDIMVPAVTAFHHFDVNVGSLDLRSVEYLFPNFPRLAGTIGGTATLDSSWLDVRFSNADVTHRNGAAEPTRALGSGRVTWGAKFMTYDLALDLQPLNLTMLAASYRDSAGKLFLQPLRGTYAGPLQAKGTLADLQLDAALRGLHGEADSVSFAGTVDLDPPGYTVRGRGRLVGLDVRAVVDDPRTVPTRLTGSYDVAMSGDSLADLEGAAALDLARSDVNGVRIFPSRARLRFAQGRAYVDTLRVETTAATLVARGALGLPHGPTDSLRVLVTVDSLGGLRRWLDRTVVGSRTPTAGADSLAGELELAATLRGRVDSLDAGGAVSGRGVYLWSDEIANADGRFTLANLLAAPSGEASLHLDTVTVAGLRLDTAAVAIRVRDASHFGWTAGARSVNGPTVALAGSVAIDSVPARRTVLTLDSLAADVQKSQWRLVRPARLTSDDGGLVLDSLIVRNAAGGAIAASGRIPMAAPVSIGVRADSVPLADVAVLLQLPTAMSGAGTLAANVAGTREQPVVEARAVLTDFRFGGLHVERATAGGDYRDRRFGVVVGLERNGRQVLRATAELPVKLAFFDARLLGDTLRGSIRADSADFAIVETLSPGLKDAKGSFLAVVNVGGTIRHPLATGRIAVRSGEVTIQNLGIRLKGIDGGVTFSGDSVQALLAAWSGAGPANRIGIDGWLEYGDLSDPSFHIGVFAQGFHALDRRTLAKLDLSTGRDSLTLDGRLREATLAGTVTVDRGTIFLPERDLARKQLEDLSEADLQSASDSTDRRQILPDAPRPLMEHIRLGGVRVVLGDEVWLRSREANVKLAGSLNVTKATDESRAARAMLAGRTDQRPNYLPALEGTLVAERGTYTLDLGVVQREFQVQSGGTVTFDGTAEAALNPFVDIRARHVVRRAGRPDLGVTVRVVGPAVPNPSLELASDESYLSQSDIVSYLVTGQPAVELNASAQQYVESLLPTVTTVVTEKVRQRFSSWVDLLQIQGGSASDLSGGYAGQGAQRRATDFLFGTRLTGGKQITNDIFFSLSAGFCSLDQRAGAQQQSFIDALGGKLEYRLNPNSSLQAGREPSTQALYCNSAATRSLVPTPSQWSFSLLRTWRF